MDKTRRPHKLYGRYLQGTLTAVDTCLGVLLGISAAKYQKEMK